MAGEILRDLQDRHLAAVLADSNLFSDADFVGGDVDLAAIHLYVPVTHQLARLAPGNAEAKTVDDIVEAAFELLEQLFAGHTFRSSSILEVVAELAFLGEVNALGFLLFAQLQAIAYNLGLLVFPVLSGSVVTLLNRTLIAEALGALEEELDAFPAA